MMELALLQIELEEKGGPSEDNEAFEHLLSCEKKFLGVSAFLIRLIF
jgi:hypothetical protein